jgi:hypothetical protein
LLAAIEENDNVITLRPAALDRYHADIDRLAALLPRPDLAIGSELEDSIHMLISAIIIHAPANSEKLEMEIRGRLDELLQAPTFSRGAGYAALLNRRKAGFSISAIVHALLARHEALDVEPFEQRISKLSRVPP